MTEKEKKQELFKIIGVETESDKAKFRYWVRNDSNPILQKLISFAIDSIEHKKIIEDIKKSF